MLSRQSVHFGPASLRPQYPKMDPELKALQAENALGAVKVSNQVPIALPLAKLYPVPQPETRKALL